MANLTIRNLDDAVVEALKARAKDHNRSLESEVREILAERVRRQTRGEELAARARAFAARTSNVGQSDSTDLIREDRDR